MCVVLVVAVIIRWRENGELGDGAGRWGGGMAAPAQGVPGPACVTMAEQRRSKGSRSRSSRRTRRRRRRRRRSKDGTKRVGTPARQEGDTESTACTSRAVRPGPGARCCTRWAGSEAAGRPSPSPSPSAASAWRRVRAWGCGGRGREAALCMRMARAALASRGRVCRRRAGGWVRAPGRPATLTTVVVVPLMPRGVGGFNPEMLD